MDTVERAVRFTMTDGELRVETLNDKQKKTIFMHTSMVDAAPIREVKLIFKMTSALFMSLTSLFT